MLRSMLLGSFLVGAVLVVPVAAQESDADRIAALETAVAELQGQVSGRAATTPVPTPSSGSDEVADILTRAAGGSTAAGTRDDPFRLGETASVGGWDVTVNGTAVASYDELLAANQFNDPATEGRSFVLFDVEVTNNTDEAGAVFVTLAFGAVGPDNVAATSSNASCGVVPGELESITEVFPGGSLSGNICLQLDESSLDETLLFVNSWGNNDDRVWFSLD